MNQNESHLKMTDNTYGCHNTPRETGYWAQDGHELATDPETGITYGITKLVWINDRSKTGCQFDLKDSRCEGCRK